MGAVGAIGVVLMREFCRSEEPIVFDDLVGFVRVCLEVVRKFDIPKVVVIVLDIVGRSSAGSHDQVRDIALFFNEISRQRSIVTEARHEPEQTKDECSLW